MQPWSFLEETVSFRNTWRVRRTDPAKRNDPVLSGYHFRGICPQRFFEALLGEDAYDPEKRKEQSLELQVTKDTPPTFLWHTEPDDCVPVENSLFFFEALHKNKIPVEMHIYPAGGHGLSLANEETKRQDGSGIQPECQSWMELACGWMSRL